MKFNDSVQWGYGIGVFMSESQKSLSPENSRVKINYEADIIHPMGWGISKSDTVNYKITDDNTLYLSDSSFGEFQSRLTYQWDCDFEQPVTIEARIKIEKCEDIGGCGIFFGDGEVCELLTLFSNRLEFRNSIQSYSMDTTDGFHDYKIEINNGKVNLFVGGDKVLSSVLKVASCRDHIGFGGFGSPGSGWWDYFKFEYNKRKPIVGGTVEFDNLNVVRIDAAPLNFSFAHNFSDGTIWLCHSIGQHMTDERGSALWSLDNGKTWSAPEIELKTLDTCQLEDGAVVSLRCWDSEIKRKHDAKIYRWSSPRSSQDDSEDIEIVLPYPAALLLHRSLIVLRDGRLLASGYGRSETNNLKNKTLFLESKDEGKTWQFLSDISKGSPGTEGYCEPCLLELDNGNILCLMRTGGSLNEWVNEDNSGPLMQSISKDGGKTWSKPCITANYGVNPHAIKLADGTLVAAAGRPGMYMLVDFTGTAENWQQIKVYSGPGSSYPSLAEVAPGKVLLFYDESAFCLDKGPSVFNRIMCMGMTVRCKK